MPVTSLLTLTALLLAGLVIAWAGAVALYARGLLRPPRMSDGKAMAVLGRLTPDDLGLAFEPVVYTVGHGPAPRLRLAAWWLPATAPSGTTVLVVHGYADAKVGALAWAPALRSTGANLLLVDLRAHGDSDGVWTTGGHVEREDISAILATLRAARPRETARVYLFGASLGSAVVSAVASSDTALAGVILDSPYADHPRAIDVHGRLSGLPGPVIRTPAIRLTAWRTGADYAAVATTATLPAANCPALLILPTADPFSQGDDRARLLAATAELTSRHPATTLWTPDCGHLEAVAVDPPAYAAQIAAFMSATA